jgi:predicted DNA-binding transcriptional regulator YafY
LRALTKLRQVLPSRLHYRLDSLRYATEHAPFARTTVDVSVLVIIAEACSRHERLRFDYRRHDGTELRREVEPHRLVSMDRRWYLVGWDVEKDAWRTFRADRLTPRSPAGPRFEERELPEGAADLVAKGVAGRLTEVWARVRLHAPAERIAPMVRAHTGSVEPEGPQTCVLTCGGDSVRTIAWWLGSFDTDFTVLEPEELTAECARLGRRYLQQQFPRTDEFDTE